MVSPHTDEFLELLASSQSRRLDDQRASFSELPGLRLRQHSQPVLGHLMASSNRDLDDDFFDILIKCQVRLNNNLLSFCLWGCSCASCYCSPARKPLSLSCALRYTLIWQIRSTKVGVFKNYLVSNQCNFGNTVTIKRKKCLGVCKMVLSV